MKHSPEEITLVVLAAGIGSRYGGIKQMDPIGPAGEFILDYSAYDAIRAGFNRIVFVISPAIEEPFRAVLGARIGRRVAVDYALQTLTRGLPAGEQPPPERKKPWGTGHAVLCCREQVEGPFAVINADDYYGVESYAMLARFLRETAADSTRHAMVGFVLRNTLSEHGTVARGVCTAAPDGRLLSVVERTRIREQDGAIRFEDDDGNWVPMTGDEQVSMNLWGFKPSLFRHLEDGFRAFLAGRARDPKAEFFVPSLVNELIAARAAEVTLLRTPCAWFGVTYPQDKAMVVERIRALVAQGTYPARLWA